MPNSIAYDIIRKSLVDIEFINTLKADPKGTLTKEGIQSEDQSGLIDIINWAFLGRNLQTEELEKTKKSSQDTRDVASAMQQGLRNTIDQIDSAFRHTMFMYQTSFYIGVILIIFAVSGAFFLKETVLSAVFGSLGMADILTFFLAKPQEKLQSSRANLAQMQAALYNWFIDSANHNTYLNSNFDMATLQRVSESLTAHTEKTLEMLQKSKVS